MNIDKCITCKNYDSFFGNCNLYIKEGYIDEGKLDIRPVSIKEINKNECEYKQKVSNNDR